MKNIATRIREGQTLADATRGFRKERSQKRRENAAENSKRDEAQSEKKKAAAPDSATASEAGES